MALTNLSLILQSLKPVLLERQVVFCTVKTFKEALQDEPIGVFREPEGVTVILTKAQADQRRFDYSGVFSQISLLVYSSLEAVGLTAAVAAALTHHNISCNVVAAYHHDHIFVPAVDADRTVAILENLSLHSSLEPSPFLFQNRTHANLLNVSELCRAPTLSKALDLIFASPEIYNLAAAQLQNSSWASKHQQIWELPGREPGSVLGDPSPAELLMEEASLASSYHFGPTEYALSLQASKKVAVLGDIHGSIHCFARLLTQMQVDGIIDEQFRIAEGWSVVLLGDFVDRGPSSLAVLVVLAKLLKFSRKGSCVALRGNHDHLVTTGFAAEGPPNHCTVVSKGGRTRSSLENKVSAFISTLPTILVLRSSTNAILFSHALFDIRWNLHKLLASPVGTTYPLVCPKGRTHYHLASSVGEKLFESELNSWLVKNSKRDGILVPSCIHSLEKPSTKALLDRTASYGLKPFHFRIHDAAESVDSSEFLVRRQPVISDRVDAELLRGVFAAHGLCLLARICGHNHPEPGIVNRLPGPLSAGWFRNTALFDADDFQHAMNSNSSFPVFRGKLPTKELRAELRGSIWKRKFQFETSPSIELGACPAAIPSSHEAFLAVDFESKDFEVFIHILPSLVGRLDCNFTGLDPKTANQQTGT